MKKTLFALYCLFINVNVYSQRDTVVLNEMVITSSRLPVIYSDYSRAISIINKQEISFLPGRNISDLLEHALNVDLRQRSSSGVQADLSIRGGSFEQSLILLNGIKMNDPQTGHHSLNIPICPEDIEKIEILEGPGSRIFGPNAFSGAINIITSASETNKLNISLTGGQFSFFNLAFRGSIKSGIINNSFSFSRNKSDGYTGNTDYNILNLFYDGILNMDLLDIEIQAGYQKKEFGANSFYSIKYPDQFENTGTAFIGGKISSGRALKFISNFNWRGNKDKFELFRNNPPSWYKGHNYHLTDVYSGDANLSYNLNNYRFALGMEFRSENILSNVLGTPMTNFVMVENEENIFYTNSAVRNNINIFMESAAFYEYFSASAGFLASWNSDFFWNFFPGIDFSYVLSEKLKLFCSINKSLRLPTFTDLYYSGPTNIGNPKLTPETAVSYEAGIKYLSKNITGHISIFRREADNLIDWVRQNENMKWESKNLTEVNSTGLEIGMKIFPIEISRYSFFKFINISYSYLDQEKKSELISLYVMDYLKHKLSINAGLSVFSELMACISLSYQSRNGIYQDPGGTEMHYKPYFLLDTKINYNMSRLKFFIEASNLFNTAYYDFGNITMPGRWIKGGIEVEFGL